MFLSEQRTHLKTCSFFGIETSQIQSWFKSQKVGWGRPVFQSDTGSKSLFLALVSYLFNGINTGLSHRVKVLMFVGRELKDFVSDTVQFCAFQDSVT